MNIHPLTPNHTPNMAVEAMLTLQNSMKGEGEKSGLLTDSDITALVKEIRTEIELLHCPDFSEHE